jgi:hypothetical protein
LGIFRKPWILPERTSAGLGSDTQYLSVSLRSGFRTDCRAFPIGWPESSSTGDVERTVEDERGRVTRTGRAAKIFDGLYHLAKARNLALKF